jgi:hypothetical protein
MSEPGFISLGYKQAAGRLIEAVFSTPESSRSLVVVVVLSRWQTQKKPAFDFRNAGQKKR